MPGQLSVQNATNGEGVIAHGKGLWIKNASNVDVIRLLTSGQLYASGNIYTDGQLNATGRINSNDGLYLNNKKYNSYNCDTFTLNENLLVWAISVPNGATKFAVSGQLPLYGTGAEGFYQLFRAGVRGLIMFNQFGSTSVWSRSVYSYDGVWFNFISDWVQA